MITHTDYFRFQLISKIKISFLSSAQFTLQLKTVIQKHDSPNYIDFSKKRKLGDLH